MRRFWVDRCFLQGNHFLLKGDLYRHIARVCRIKKGESFELLAEGVHKYQVRLDSVHSSYGLAAIEKIYPVPSLPKPEIHLALSLPRLKTADTILEKAVEMGVKSFHPFVSEFSFFKNSSFFSEQKLKRWKNIVTAASAQSLRTELLEIFPLTDFRNLPLPTGGDIWMAYEGMNSEIYDFNRTEQKKEDPVEVWLFIGSEGGFSPAEAEWLSKEKKGRLFSLGERILRVETACVMALTLLKYRYQRIIKDAGNS